MKGIYDNGYQLLGNVKDIINMINNNIEKGSVDLEETIDLLNDLKELSEEEIVVIDYDYGMGYRLVSWHLFKDLIKECE